jgi:hypothetical protein
MPSNTSSFPKYSDRVSPLLHSPSGIIHPQKTPTSYWPTSERSIKSNFDSRERRGAPRGSTFFQPLEESEFRAISAYCC